VAAIDPSALTPGPPGSEHPWPDLQDRALALLEGEVVLIAERRGPDGTVLDRRTLQVLVAPCQLPVPPTIRGVHWRLKVVQQARLGPGPAGPAAAVVSLPAIDPLLAAPPSPALPAAAAPQPLDTLVGWLAERHGTRPQPPAASAAAAAAAAVAPAAVAPAAAPATATRLAALLERAGLISRPLRLERSDLQRDCGDLVLLGEPGPLLLLAGPRGYRVRDPAQPDQPPQPLHRQHLPASAGPLHALGVLPALQARDLSAQGLVRFSYGPASRRTAVLLLATGLGLALGFLLAVGREVGAARWIAGLGGLGALLGTGLALLSDPLRPALLTALLGSVLGLLLPTVNTLLTNQALPDRDASLMLQLGGLLLAAALADAGLRWTQARTLLTVQQRGGHRLELAALQRLLRLPLSFFQRYRAGELTLRFGAIAQVQAELQALLSGGTLQALLCGVYLLFMLRISATLTGLAVLLAALLVLPTVWIGRRCRRWEREREENLAEASSRNLELITSVAKLRLAGAEAAAARHWWSPYRRALAAGEAAAARAALAGLLQTAIPNLGTLLLFVVITRLVAEAASTPSLRAPDLGELFGFFAAFSTFIGSVASSAGLMVQAFELPVLLERARPLLLAEPEDGHGGLDPGVLQGRIAVVAVSFRYRDGGPWVLDNLSLELEPGDFVAVVGASGSGKSTLVRLLLGLQSPQRGQVLIDGRPLERLDPRRLRRQIGVVPQQASLLAGTVLEVIAGGTALTVEQAWRAAEQAAIADDLRALPMGLHTVLPEGGGGLSGGQRQRLAIARALARQPRVLIFDEATSALDNHSQAEVSRSLEGLGITRLVVAHRLSTVRHADRIVVLAGGRIVQGGPFRALIDQPGPFAELMRRQLAGPAEATE